MNPSPDPFLVSWLNRISGHFQPVQWTTRCSNVELETANCVEAYGFVRGKEKCKELISDLYECVYSMKQNKRLELMHVEYLHQIKKGQKEYIPVPPVTYFNV